MESNNARPDFFVATDGDDSWSGTLSEKNADRTDGPFASLTRARDAVRELLRTGEPRHISVLIRGGTYCLQKTVVFGLEDGARDGGNVTYAAYPGEEPVFTSGVPISGWRELGHTWPEGLSEAARPHVWVADVPSSLEKFHVLFDGMTRLPRARSAGFAPTEPALKSPGGWPESEGDPKFSTLSFPEGALKNWNNLDDVEIIIRPNFLWTMNILSLESVDEQSCTAKTAIPGTYPLRQVNVWREGRILRESVWVENVCEALTAPGEWVLDTNEGKIYLWPIGDNPGNAILAPCLTELIRIEGDVDVQGPKDVPVKGISIKGLTLAQADRGSWAPGDAGIQHDWEMIDKPDALIRLRGAEGCEISGCTFTASGGSAVRLDLHCRENLVLRNEINHLGGAGILLIGYGPGTKDVNNHNRIVDNHIHHCGEIHWHSHGIVMWQSGDNVAAHNTIHHMPRKAFCLSGIRPWYFDRGNYRSKQRECGRSVRWHEIPNADEVSDCGHGIAADMGEEAVTWEPLMPYLHCRNNVVEENEVYRVNQLLGDGSSINISGAGEGNIIRRNFVHDIYNPYIHGAIRTDDFQRGTLIEENIICRTNASGLCLRHENYVINNLVIDVRPDHYIWIGHRPFDGSKIIRNIFFHPEAQDVFYLNGSKSKTDVIAHLGNMKSGEIDGNVYFAAAGPGAVQPGAIQPGAIQPGAIQPGADRDLKALKEEGLEKAGTFADPLFVDWEHGDFALKPGSPALALGVKSVDLSGVGITWGKSDP